MANDAKMPERIWAFKVNCGDVYTTEWNLNEGDAKADRDNFDHAEYLRRDLCASGQVRTLCAAIRDAADVAEGGAA